ncbi:MAG TPA: BON domain-containing protein [Vicinamibacterales bacterium]|nr:BON domain-containing protein [Vicinamibacterales bacterium]
MLSRDWRNRASGLAARWDRADTRVDDVVIEARVRSSLGRVTSHPGTVGVASIDGMVTLTGPVLAAEHAAICRAVGRVRGVGEVIDQLTQHEQAGSVPGLQGDGAMRTASGEWSPAVRALFVIAGAGLVAYGIRQRTVAAGLGAALGAALLSRSLIDLDLPGRVTELLDVIDDARDTPRFDLEASDHAILGGGPLPSPSSQVADASEPSPDAIGQSDSPRTPAPKRRSPKTRKEPS